MHVTTDEIAEPVYARYGDPKHTRAARFGRFVSRSELPYNLNSNQLFDCRCRADEVDDVLAELEQLYAPTGDRTA